MSVITSAVFWFAVFLGAVAAWLGEMILNDRYGPFAVAWHQAAASVMAIAFLLAMATAIDETVREFRR